MTLTDEHRLSAIEPERVDRVLPLVATAATAGFGAEVLLHPWLVDWAARPVERRGRSTAPPCSLPQ